MVQGISEVSVTLYWRINTLGFNSDGSVNVEMVRGFEEDGVFITIDSRGINVPNEIVSTILDVAPQEGLTRRTDIISAVYGYILSNNLVLK